MGLDWTSQLIKYVLLLVNFLFVISGIILIIVGATIKTYYNKYDLFLSNSYFDLANLLIAIGAMVLIFAIIGCYGTLSEKWLIIFGFSILLGIIFIMEFSGAIAGYALRDKTTNYLTNKMTSTMDKYSFNEKPNEITFLWDTVQKTFGCCGAVSPEDWAQHKPKELDEETRNSTEPFAITTSTNITTTAGSASPESIPTNDTKTLAPTTLPPTTLPPTTLPTPPAQRDETLDLPGSCCTPNAGTAGYYICNLGDNSTATFYKTGCVTRFGNYLKSHAVTLAGTAVGIAVFQLIAVILAYRLSMKLRNGLYTS